MTPEQRDLKQRQLAGLQAREVISEDCARAIAQLQKDLGDDVEGKARIEAEKAREAELVKLRADLVAANKEIAKLKAELAAGKKKVD